MCLFPKLIRNKKYTNTKKNKGNIPQAEDRRVLYIPAACGNCIECRKAKARDWTVRLIEEIRFNKTGVFVTLSFSDESLYDLEHGIDLRGKQVSEPIYMEGYNLDNEIAKRAVKFFRERWRKKYGKSVRYWLITELGQESSERIHLHGLIWGNMEQKLEIDNLWSYGNVWLGNYVNESTVHYIVKYMSKQDEKHKEYKPMVFTSPGIGSNYLERWDSKRHKYIKGKTIEEYKLRSGEKVALPVYYRNKIYTEREKELLWLEKLDKNIRWVDGRLIDVKDGDDMYYKALEVAREKNRFFGYGDDSINWERRKYENDRRNLKKLERYAKFDDNSIAVDDDGML